MDAGLLAQYVMNGLMLGMMYALVAVGFTLFFGVLDVIKFSHGDVLSVRRNGTMTGISADELRQLSMGDYQELRIERKIVVVPDAGDEWRIPAINRAAAEIIRDLKAVLAH